MKLRRNKRPNSGKGLKVTEEGQSTPSTPDLSPKSKQRLSLLHCKDCGQSHEGTKPHLFDYDQTVDKELTCHICHQPLVDPVDTKCGHTYCQKCMHGWLKEKFCCPTDKRALTKDDVRPASQILRKLLDKLLVVCPNVDYCEEVLPRCELQAHLQYRCKGAVIKCLRGDQGCTFQGPRSALQSHLWDCPFRDFSKDPDSIGWVPVSDGGVTTLDIQRGCYELGISVVGGIDTPLMCIVIQDVHAEGVVAKDGRLQSGDQLLEVNGIDLTNATHAEARDALKQPYPVFRLSVYREKSESACSIQKQEILDLTLPKLPGQHLGIKLVNKRNGPGLYIQELIPGTLAFLDNKLKKDDRILSIGENDMTYGSQEQASKFIQDARERVHFRVSRQVTISTIPDITHDSPSKESLLNFSVYSKESLFSYFPFKQCQEKLVSITKLREESLGISVAGGLRNQRGDSPIYVTNILSTGCVGRCQEILKGDILLSINGHSLLDLTHTEAVRLLKTWATDTQISLKMLEGTETCGGLDNFAPSWKYWLCLPEFCHIVKTIQLERSTTGSLGFSIVGGCDSGQGLVPIYVKAVVPGTPASDDGRLRSGDMLLGVNGQSLENVTHTQAVSLLKGAKGNKVTLRIVSWPGSYV